MRAKRCQHGACGRMMRPWEWVLRDRGHGIIAPRCVARWGLSVEHRRIVRWCEMAGRELVRAVASTSPRRASCTCRPGWNCPSCSTTAVCSNSSAATPAATSAVVSTSWPTARSWQSILARGGARHRGTRVHSRPPPSRPGIWLPRRASSWKRWPGHRVQLPDPTPGALHAGIVVLCALVDAEGHPQCQAPRLHAAARALRALAAIGALTKAGHKASPRPVMRLSRSDSS